MSKSILKTKGQLQKITNKISQLKEKYSSDKYGRHSETSFSKNTPKNKYSYHSDIFDNSNKVHRSHFGASGSEVMLDRKMRLSLTNAVGSIRGFDGEDAEDEYYRYFYDKIRSGYGVHKNYEKKGHNKKNKGVFFDREIFQEQSKERQPIVYNQSQPIQKKEQEGSKDLHSHIQEFKKQITTHIDKIFSQQLLSEKRVPKNRQKSQNQLMKDAQGLKAEIRQQMKTEIKQWIQSTENAVTEMNSQLHNFYKEWITYKENQGTKSEKNKKIREEMQEKLLGIEKIYEEIRFEQNKKISEEVGKNYLRFQEKNIQKMEEIQNGVRNMKQELLRVNSMINESQLLSSSDVRRDYALGEMQGKQGQKAQKDLKDYSSNLLNSSGSQFQQISIKTLLDYINNEMNLRINERFQILEEEISKQIQEVKDNLAYVHKNHRNDQKATNNKLYVKEKKHNKYDIFPGSTVTKYIDSGSENAHDSSEQNTKTQHLVSEQSQQPIYQNYNYQIHSADNLRAPLQQNTRGIQPVLDAPVLDKFKTEISMTINRFSELLEQSLMEMENKMEKLDINYAYLYGRISTLEYDNASFKDKLSNFIQKTKKNQLSSSRIQLQQSSLTEQSQQEYSFKNQSPSPKPEPDLHQSMLLGDSHLLQHQNSKQSLLQKLSRYSCKQSQVKQSK